MSDLERDVARHYQASDLAARVLEALRAAGKDIGRLTPDDLAPVDEFHVGGRAATIHALEKLHLHKDQHVLDVGCGIGGAARYVAHTFGCRVTGIDDCGTDRRTGTTSPAAPTAAKANNKSCGQRDS